MHPIKLFVIGICKNSFGPWALVSGPRIPVITNYDFGNKSPNNFINGIEPPIANYAEGFPKNLTEDSLIESSSHF